MTSTLGELWAGKVQIGKEVAAGTEVAATRILYAVDPAFTYERESRLKRFATGTVDNARAHRLGRKAIGGRLTIPMSPDEILELLEIGVEDTSAISTPGGGTNSRDHEYVAGGSALASATLEIDDGADEHTVLGVRANSLRFTFDAKGEANVEAELFGLDRNANALTAALTERIPHFSEGWETQIAIGAHNGDVGGYANVDDWLIRGSITLNNNLGRKAFANNSNAFDAVVRQQLDVTAELLLEAANGQSQSEFSNYDGNTLRAMRITIGNNDVIEGALKKTVWLDFQGAFSAYDFGQTDEGTRAYRLTAVGVYAPTRAYTFRVTCRTDRTAAF